MGHINMLIKELKYKGFYIKLIAIIEAAIILCLIIKVQNIRKLQKGDEALMAKLVRSHLVADAALMNALNIKLRRGDIATVNHIFQSSISTNVLILKSEAYGKPDTDENEALGVIVRSMANWERSD